MPAPFEDDLTKVTTPSRAGDGEFQLDVPDGWQQGRGAFGGLVLAALARAIEASEPETDRVLRSLMGELSAPVLVGPATIRVRPVRRGAGVSTFRATLLQDGEERAGVTAILGRARATLTPWAPPPPALPPFDTVAVAPVGPPFAPEFARFLEFRPTGPLPFSGGKEPTAAGWIRPRRCSSAVLGIPEIIAIADAWWPAAFAIEPAPRPWAPWRSRSSTFRQKRRSRAPSPSSIAPRPWPPKVDLSWKIESFGPCPASSWRSTPRPWSGSARARA